MERVYTIPLRNVKNVQRTIRAPRAIREVRNFLTKHMKAEEVKIDASINHMIWERGIQKIPSKITVKAVKDDDGVVEATYGTDTVNTMVQLFSSVRVGGLVFVAALICLAIFLIRNTIKLAIQVRKDEIQIMRQVGAMNWYITVPFVLEGLLTGFLGALIPSLICIFGYTALYQALNGVFISELFVLKDPYPFLLYICGVLFLIGILAGMLGSYLASRKYLRWTR